MRVVGLDVHRTFALIVFFEAGVLQSGGKVELTADRLVGFGRSPARTDEVVLEATGNTAANTDERGNTDGRFVIFIRGVDDLAHLCWEGEERIKCFPVSPSALSDGGIFSAKGL